MTLFTVQLEIGPETRAMIERVATSAVLQIELGPKTRKTIEAIGVAMGMPRKAKARGAIEGLLGRGADEATQQPR